MLWKTLQKLCSPFNRLKSAMAYTHGVYVREEPTPIFGVRTVDSALPFVVGLAPQGPVKEPVLIFNKRQYSEIFGNTGDTQTYTLQEFANVYFDLYRMSPVVFVNVFDPATHVDVNGNPDPSAVTEQDIIDGLNTVDLVFPKFGKVVGTIVVPKWSKSLNVANQMIAKAENISGHFKAMAYIEANGTTVQEFVSFKQNFSSPHAVVFAPSVVNGNTVYDLATHGAGLTAKVDERNGGIPYESPSNKELRIDSPELVLSLQEANYLNEQGIVTAFRMISGWKLWGNRTAAFPANTDIKDSFIPNRRMANWIENNLILNTWQKVDNPMNKRLIESIVDTWNIFLGGLQGRGFLLGARVYFLEEDNPETDLANGIIRFRINYLSPPPAETIEFILTVDLSYFETLFK